MRAHLMTLAAVIALCTVLPQRVGMAQVQGVGRDMSDVVIVVDESGSLKHNDRERLRVDSLKIVPAVCPARITRLALIGFGDEARLYTDPQQPMVSPKEIEQAFNKIKIEPSDLEGHTDVLAALRKVATVLEQRDRKYPVTIIFFTDGEMNEVDVPDHWQTELGAKFYQKYQDLLAQEVVKFQKNHWRICPVAFSPMVDTKFLTERLAEPTGGKVVGARNSLDIPLALSDILVGSLPIASINKPADLHDVFNHTENIEYPAEQLVIEVYPQRVIANESDRPTIKLLEPGSTQWRKPPEITATSLYTIGKEPDPKRGEWKIRVSGPATGQASVRISVYTGLRTEVLAPESRKTDAPYTGSIPIAFRVTKLLNTASFEGLAGSWVVTDPTGKKTPGKLVAETASADQLVLKGEFPVESNGSHMVSMALERGQSEQKQLWTQEIKYCAAKREPRIKDVKWNQDGHSFVLGRDGKASLSGTVQATAVDFPQPVRMNLVCRTDPANAGLSGSVTPSEIVLPPGEPKSFQIEMTFNAAQLPLPKPVQLQLWMEGTAPKDAAGEQRKLSIQAGAITIVSSPLATLAAVDPQAATSHQPVKIIASINGKVSQPPAEINATVTANANAERAAVTLKPVGNGRYEGTFAAVNPGEYTVALAAGEGYEPESSTLTLRVDRPRFTCERAAYDFDEMTAGAQKSETFIIKAERLFAPCTLTIAAETPGIADLEMTLPQAQVELTPEKPQAAVKFVISAGKTLPFWAQTAHIIVRCSDMPGEEARVTIRAWGPVPWWLTVLIIVVLLLFAALATFVFKSKAPVGTDLVRLTPQGGEVDRCALRDKQRFWRFSITLGDASADINIEESGIPAAIKPGRGGRLQLVAYSDEVLTGEQKVKEQPGQRIVLAPGMEFAIGQQRFRIEKPDSYQSDGAADVSSQESIY